MSIGQYARFNDPRFEDQPGAAPSPNTRTCPELPRGLSSLFDGGMPSEVQLTEIYLTIFAGYRAMKNNEVLTIRAQELNKVKFLVPTEPGSSFKVSALGGAKGRVTKGALALQLEELSSALQFKFIKEHDAEIRRSIEQGGEDVDANKVILSLGSNLKRCAYFALKEPSKSGPGG